MSASIVAEELIKVTLWAAKGKGALPGRGAQRSPAGRAG